VEDDLAALHGSRYKLTVPDVSGTDVQVTQKVGQAVALAAGEVV
jgi:hypothetical protein